MEIAPIPGVRALLLLNVQKTIGAQPPPFEIESSARTGDETYSSSHECPDRGLEAEDSDFAQDGETEPEVPPPPSKTGSRINYFA
jgi:hypothetical protein